MKETSAISSCLIQEASAIAQTAEKLEPEQVEAALNLLEDCANNRSKLIITGVGKSGIVARKIAATFTSIGIIAIYLNPLDALHGDLGVIASNDLVLLISNSGETEELLEILPHLKKRGTCQIALVGRMNSSLAKDCNVVLNGSVDREVCPLDMAPTASTAVAMAIGDALAAVWMKRRGITLEEFAINHPAGTLGKKLTLRAIDLMIPVEKLSPLGPQTPLLEIISRLTADGIGSCWIANPLDDHIIQGLITDGDLRRALQSHHPREWNNLIAADLMTADPITVQASSMAIKAMEMMERNTRKAISVLPVLDEMHRMRGLLRLHDLVQAGLK